MRWASVARAGTSAPLRRRSGSGAGPRRSSPGPPRLACRRPRSCARCSPGLVDPSRLARRRPRAPPRPTSTRACGAGGSRRCRRSRPRPRPAGVPRRSSRCPEPARRRACASKGSRAPASRDALHASGPVRSSSSMSTDTRRGAVAAARWARASIRSLEPAIDTPPEPTSERRARSSPSGKASPQYRVASGPTKTSAPHSMSSGPDVAPPLERPSAAHERHPVGRQQERQRAPRGFADGKGRHPQSVGGSVAAARARYDPD